jgi:hypothetical protein
MTRRTAVSVFHGDKMLFCSDSFPVIPNVGEVISVRENDKSARFVVEGREFIFQKYTNAQGPVDIDREVMVILRVRRPGFVD